jgi:hypothetical protein
MMLEQQNNLFTQSHKIFILESPLYVIKKEHNKVDLKLCEKWLPLGNIIHIPRIWHLIEISWNWIRCVLLTSYMIKSNFMIFAKLTMPVYFAIEETVKLKCISQMKVFVMVNLTLHNLPWKSFWQVDTWRKQNK